MDFFRKSRTNVVPSILKFPAIDIDGMAKRLRLKERANDLGRSNQPPTNSESFDFVEQEICNELSSEAKQRFDQYLAIQRTYSDRAADAGVRAFVAQIASIAGDSITDFEKNTHAGAGRLYAMRREVVETEQSLNEFKRKNALTRPPQDQGSKAFKIGLLIFILAIESILNGFFLAQGNVFGLVGGVFTALLIAALNISAGLVAGLLILPHIYHRSIPRKVVGMFGLASYCAAAVAFNLAVAHYRSAVGVDPFEASATALQSLVSAPLAINDLESWALLIVGLLFSLIATIDGLKLDDPYPGYGSRHRQHLAAVEEYSNIKEDLLDDLQEIKKAAELAMDDLSNRVENRQREMATIVTNSNAAKSEMRNHLEHLESSANALLAFYRQENARCRSDPPPRRFLGGGKWSLPDMAFSNEVVAKPDPGSDEAIRAEAAIKLIQARSALHDAYREAFSEYRKIDDLVDFERSK